MVREERRMRVESSPQGKLVEALLATAFAAHPYRNMPGGWASDIENFRLTEAIAFYKKYYVPANITIGIAGDVDPKECRRLADKYFSILPSGPLPSGPRTVEPVQKGEKRVEVESPAQPFMAIAYKRPNQLDKDDPVFDVLGEILAGERTGLVLHGTGSRQEDRAGRGRGGVFSRAANIRTCFCSSWCRIRATPWRKTRRPATRSSSA